ETHLQGAVVAYLDLAGFPGLAVAHLRAAFETARGGGTADPVRRFTAQRGGLQPRAVVALVDEQHVARHVLADHVPGRLLAPAHAAELEAAALAQGEVEHAGVFAQHPALRIADLAAARRDVLREELAEIALADETDAGGVLLGRRRQARFGGQRAHLLLAQSTEREARRRQLLLAKQMQEVALVLVAVDRAQQAPRGPVAFDPRVVAGGDRPGAERARGVEEMPELDLAIAKHVRVRRAAGGVLCDEVLEHAVPVFARKIAEVQGDAEASADGDRVAAVVRRAALAAAVVGPVVHEHAGNVFALALQ